MKVYFACSITGGREFEPVFQAITRTLQADGHIVPTAHLADAGIKALEAKASAIEIYERDVAWIRACDALVAEVSTPSHGVGYEVSFALGIGKPVLCVARKGRPVSKMLTGNTTSGFRMEMYQNVAEVLAKIRDFLAGIPSNL